MKILTGKITSIKQQNTIVVEVERFHRHPLYEKRIRRTKKYQVHSVGVFNTGQVVRFVETRPISKTKRWKVVEENVKTGKVKKENKI